MPRNSLLAGEIVAERFVIEQEASTGGMGIIYKALDTQTNTAVALKCLTLQGELDAERFLQEGSLLKTLAHPAIVRYIGHGTTSSGQHYLAMEWLTGEDLGARLSRKGLTLQESISLVQRVSEALE